MTANLDLHCLFSSFRGQCFIFKLLGCFVLLHLCTQCGCYLWMIHFFHCHPPRIVARNPPSPTPWDLHDNICLTFYDGYNPQVKNILKIWGQIRPHSRPFILRMPSHGSFALPQKTRTIKFVLTSKKTRTIKFVEERKELMQARRITKDCWKKSVRNLWRI
jgi:hypothetical protein